ncbi:caspase family protein [Paenibacillus senegalimassiliensis]|uniref:caspase family protein n=1 Tax=Paenibacillus senegalimassiliensis TaxID=1737426 RepID=UPI00073E43BE|nr:caspase family protein [Paenibacillus senegalimassiliensis]
MKKLALVVGINYEGTDNSLGGCINDTKEMCRLLVNKFGFKIEDIQLLIEEYAIKKNILDALELLVTSLNPGDIGVFTYSGHGTQTADFPPLDELDMLDEAIVPFDGLASPSNLIRDDEIKEKLSKLKQDVHFTIIFDSCNSGDGTKFLENEDKKKCLDATPTITKIKELINEVRPDRQRAIKSHALSGPNHILLAGCKSNQYSYDDGKNGYLTGALMEFMEKGMTYEELHTKVYAKVKKRSNDSQLPQLEGPMLSRKVLE